MGAVELGYLLALQDNITSFQGTVDMSHLLLQPNNEIQV